MASSDSPSLNWKYSTVPECLLYHSLSELNGREGYFPNISERQLKAINDLINLLQSNNLILFDDGEHEFLKLLRFLRARQFDIQASFEMINSDVSWRHDSGKNTLRNELGKTVLECEPSDVTKYFPTWLQGYDKQGRPISWRQFGKFEIWNILKATTLDNLVKFHAWENEQMLRLMGDASIRTNRNIETFVIIIDAEGWSMRLATSDAFAFIKEMVRIDSSHYPERLGMLIIINAPTMLSFAWRIIQNFLDEVTKAKIKIVSNPKDWKVELGNHIDMDQIPIMYGGTSPDPPFNDLIKTMDPPTI